MALNKSYEKETTESKLQQHDSGNRTECGHATLDAEGNIHRQRSLKTRLNEILIP